MKNLLLLSASLFLFVSCGGGDSENNLADDIEEITVSMPSSEREPCNYIDEATIREIFGVGNTIEITSSDSYGLCTFQWDGLTEVERTAADEEMTNAMMAAVTSGKMLDRSAMQKGYYNVSLNFTTAKITDAASAASTFETIDKRMSEGIKISAEQVKEKTSSISDESVDAVIKDGVTFKGGKRTEINGVGDAAVWDSKLKQLTVLSGTDIFFVTADAGGDEALSVEKSKEIANKIIDNF